MPDVDQFKAQCHPSCYTTKGYLNLCKVKKKSNASETTKAIFSFTPLSKNGITIFVLKKVDHNHSSSSSSSIGTTAHCGLWPVEQDPSIFSYLSPTLSIIVKSTQLFPLFHFRNNKFFTVCVC
jgi:hypothetical protein